MRPQRPERSCIISFMRMLAWAGSSVAAASLAHIALQTIGRADPLDAYASHWHGGLAAAIAALFVTLLCIAWREVLARINDRNDGALIAFLERSGKESLVRGVCSTAAGALAALVAMETCEALCATGHFESIADILGGSAPLGTFVVIAAACITSVTGHRVARALVDAAVIVLTPFFIILRLRRVALSRASQQRRWRSHRARWIASYTAGFALRAPPSLCA